MPANLLNTKNYTRLYFTTGHVSILSHRRRTRSRYETNVVDEIKNNEL